MSENYTNGLTHEEGVTVLNDIYSGNVHDVLSTDEIAENIESMRVYSARQLVEEKLLAEISDEHAHQIVDQLVINYIDSAKSVIQSYVDAGIHIYALTDDKIVINDN